MTDRPRRYNRAMVVPMENAAATAVTITASAGSLPTPSALLGALQYVLPTSHIAHRLVALTMAPGAGQGLRVEDGSPYQRSALVAAL
jgi:hypothetical protein